MNFLDVLDSIGGAQRPARPQAPKDTSFTPHRPRPVLAGTAPKPVARPAKIEGAPSVPNGSNRMVDEAFRVSPHRLQQQSIKPPLPKGAQGKGSPGTKTSQLPRKPDVTKPGVQAVTTTITTTTTTAKTNNEPPKGSFAALMAEAQARQQRGKSEVGQIKHQATVRERMSKVQKRKREEEGKAQKAKKIGTLQPQHLSKVEKKNGSMIPNSSRKKRPESTYKGTAKPAATAPPLLSSYKGTAGLASKYQSSSLSAGTQRHGMRRSKPSRYDEYLGTDEEDEGAEGPEGTDMDIDNNDEADRYGSDVSSDMEADAFTVEEEENRALRQAKQDDAKEMALEDQHRRDKDDRKRRLQALAKKRR